MGFVTFHQPASEAQACERDRLIVRPTHLRRARGLGVDFTRLQATNTNRPILNHLGMTLKTDMAIYPRRAMRSLADDLSIKANRNHATLDRNDIVVPVTRSAIARARSARRPSIGRHSLVCGSDAMKRATEGVFVGIETTFIDLNLDSLIVEAILREEVAFRFRRTHEYASVHDGGKDLPLQTQLEITEHALVPDHAQ
jgi:hypothetical protein